MLKKHLFLVVAIAVVALMVVLGAVKLLTGGRAGGGAGGAGGFAGAPGGAGGGFGPPGGAGGPGGAGRARATAVTPAVVTVRSFTDVVEVVGAAKARQSITVTAPASQLVTKINFESGQFVKQGQVLAELNAREQDAAILQARSQVALAKSNWDRWQQLADRGLAPAATAEQMKAAYDQAVATLQANQARASDRVIRAPFSGVVGLTDAAPGMLLNTGGALVTLDDLSAVRVDFPVPERFVSLLRGGLPITASADAYPGDIFNGRIAQLDTRLDPNTRAITSRAEFPNPGNRLKPGMMLRVKIEQGTRQNPAVPESAIVFEGGDSYVLTIAPAPRGAGAGAGQGGQRPGGGFAGGQGGGAPGGGGQGAFGGQRQGGGQGGAPGAGGAAGAQRPAFIAQRRSVKTGVRADGFVEILSGLQAGERVVADGTNRVRPNDPISIAGAGAGRQGQGAAGAGGQGGGFGGGFGGGAPAAQGRQGGGEGAAPAGGGRPAAPGGSAAGGPGAGVAAGGPPAGGPPGAGFDPQAMFQRADANRDGGISLDEWTGAGRPEQAFARIDANGDGKITLQEMQQRQRARAGQAGGAGPG